MNPTNILLAGPFIGEIGWELFCWQGILRRRKEMGNRVHVLCRQGHEFLYSDFASFSVPSTGNATKSKGGMTVWPANMHLIDYNVNRTDAFWAKQMQLRPQSFVRYFQESSVQYDVVIHARARATRASQNQPRPWWVRVVQALREKGLKVCCVGKKGASYNVTQEPTFDTPLDETGRTIASSRVAIGTSSGPMHLAALCDVPMVVLCGPENHGRYLRHWNPFDAPVRFPKGGLHPSVGSVVASCESLLKGAS